jgi:cell division protein FtsI (penicillin-binding protein 3)
MMQDFREAKQKESGEAAEKETKTRMLIVVVGCFLFAVCVAVRLLYVQLIDAGKYRDKARRQYETKVSLPANRGIIYDRQMNKLASNLVYSSFAADPNLINDQEAADEVATAFSKAFGKPKSEYLNKLKKSGNFVWLERRVLPEKANTLVEQKLAGVVEIKELNRHYEGLASQVIGFTDADGKGISGLELSLSDTLKGNDGYIIMQRDGSGRPYPSVGYPKVMPKDGLSVQLTLDMSIQAIVEDELQKGVAASGSSAGTMIAMDVKTGEILAMANYPSFDGNDKSTYSSERVRNRCITDIFEPGSTFKIVAATAAIENGIRKADDKIFAERGKYKIKDKVITDHEPLGTVTFKQAIAASSNIVMAKTGMLVGAEKFYKYATAFGFGTKTGIDLSGEVAGILRPVKEWSGISLPWMSIGYEVSVTPLQVLCAYAALANGGVRVKPFVIKKIFKPSGDKLVEHKPKDVMTVMEKSTSLNVKELFKAVVDSGTGKSARLEGIDAAGKTGTAQKLVNGSYKNHRYAASFVGFFPAEKPQVVMMVMMDSPTKGYYGSEAAAPVFAKVGNRVANSSGEYQRKVQLAMGERPNVKNIFLDTVKTVVVPDVRGLALSDAKEILKVHKVDYKKIGNADGDAKGQHVILRQEPKAGTRVKVWTKVEIEFQNSPTATQKCTMPNLVGLPLDRAVYQTKNLGLKVRFSGSGDVVQSQSPKAGVAVSSDAACVLELKEKRFN